MSDLSRSIPAAETPTTPHEPALRAVKPRRIDHHRSIIDLTAAPLILGREKP
jgi:hypothetical protein